jgi:hypothetical protein
MAKTPKPKTSDEDEAESARFIETAKALEAAGELNLTEGERALERLMAKAAPPKQRGDG